MGCPPAADKAATDSTVAVTCNEENQACTPSSCTGTGDGMLPGSDCLACHSAGVTSGGVQPVVFGAAGTAFTDPYGQAPLVGATVEVTDSTDAVVDMTTNAAGNYYTIQTLVPPIRASVTTPGGQIRMPAPQDTTSCNACHACGGLAGGHLYGEP